MEDQNKILLKGKTLFGRLLGSAHFLLSELTLCEDPVYVFFSILDFGG